jgi:hypothetical protein
MSSFLKYAQDEKILKGNGRGPLSFHRANIDGMPYRGRPHMLKEEEFQALAEVVHEVYIKEFNLSIPEQLQEYRTIIDGCLNRLYRCLMRKVERVQQPDGSFPMVAYVEYTEPAMEVPQSRLPFME